MDKLEKDGKVAVLYSPGYGAGWSTWNLNHPDHDKLIFDPEIAQAVLDKKSENEIKKIAERKYDKPDEHLCTLGVDDLTVKWLEKGEEFHISEYDGYESVELPSDLKWFTA